jgi:hypothetical protein
MSSLLNYYNITHAALGSMGDVVFGQTGGSKWHIVARMEVFEAVSMLL